ncbi:MAG: hypothetical protein UU47_C0029G0001 [candidate division TM6 bacterium GW2011_GWE2_41_16]|nr:MAG: hypothetical protein UU47_C0029G0001 [candidate division TM6 bacterium GW2011_GWE2_41_16]
MRITRMLTFLSVVLAVGTCYSLSAAKLFIRNNGRKNEAVIIRTFGKCGEYKFENVLPIPFDPNIKPLDKHEKEIMSPDKLWLCGIEEIEVNGKKVKPGVDAVSDDYRLIINPDDSLELWFVVRGYQTNAADIDDRNNKNVHHYLFQDKPGTEKIPFGDRKAKDFEPIIVK